MNLLEATLSVCVLSALWAYAIAADLPDVVMDLIAFGL